MPVWQASAARKISTATAAPEPSPSRMPRSSSGCRPSSSSRSRCPASADTWPASAWSSAPARSLASGATAAVQTKPSSSTGMRRCRAASVAPRMAASSRPPNAAATRSGSPRMRAVSCERPRRSPRACARGRVRRRRCRGRPSVRRRRRTAPPRSPRPRWCCRCPSRRAHEIGLGRDRVVAGRHGGEELGLVHRGLLGEIRRGLIEVERDDAELGAGKLRELVDGGAAGGEIRHHLRGDLGRIGRDALRGHAVIAGEHQDLDSAEPRRVACPAKARAMHDRFEPAEAARRLGERRFAGRPRRRLFRGGRREDRDRPNAIRPGKRSASFRSRL